MNTRLFAITFLLITKLYSQVNPFLPEIFQRFPNVRDLTMTNDQREIYFTVESFKKEFSYICVLKKDEENNWQQPEVASFSGQYKDLEPFLSTDGLRLYFASARPFNATDKTSKDFDIWYVDRKDLKSDWGIPVNAGPMVNSNKDEFYPSVSLSGNMYFTRMSDDKQRKEDIFMCEYKNKNFSNAQALSDSINGNSFEYNAFVAPDESYIIFTSYGRKDDMGGSDMYISIKNKEGKWLGAKHLGNINSNKIDYCPFVLNNTLYFTSERSNVSKQFDNAKSLKEISLDINQYTNGMGRIYSTSFSPNLPKN